MTLNVTSLRLGDTFACVRIFLLLKLSSIALDGSAASSFPDIWGWTLELLLVRPCIAAMKNSDQYLLKPLFSVPLNAYPVAKVLEHTTKCFQVFEGLPWSSVLGCIIFFSCLKYQNLKSWSGYLSCRLNTPTRPPHYHLLLISFCFVSTHSNDINIYHLIVTSICISLMVCDIGHLFTCLFTACIVFSFGETS